MKAKTNKNDIKVVVILHYGFNDLDTSVRVMEAFKVGDIKNKTLAELLEKVAESKEKEYPQGKGNVMEALRDTEHGQVWRQYHQTTEQPEATIKNYKVLEDREETLVSKVLPKENKTTVKGTPYKLLEITYNPSRKVFLGYALSTLTVYHNGELSQVQGREDKKAQNKKVSRRKY